MFGKGPSPVHAGDTQARNHAGGHVSSKRFRWQPALQSAMSCCETSNSSSQERDVTCSAPPTQDCANKNGSRGTRKDGATETQHVCTIAMKTPRGQVARQQGASPSRNRCECFAGDSCDASSRSRRAPWLIRTKKSAPVGNATHLQSNPQTRCARAARQRVCRKHTNEQKRRTRHKTPERFRWQSSLQSPCRVARQTTAQSQVRDTKLSLFQLFSVTSSEVTVK